MGQPHVPRVLPASAPAWAAGATGLLGVAVVALVDPSEAGRYPGCPFLSITGLQCPGCGALRAVHALTRADIITAIDLNVLVVLALPLLVWAWVAWLRSSVAGAPRSPSLPAAAAYAIAVTMTAFWVARNTPWFEVLAA